MASQIVLNELEKLHTELNRMQPAVRQVELTEQLIQEAKKIPESYLKFSALIEKQEAEFKEQLVGELNKRADLLHEEVKAVIASADSIVAKLNVHDKELGILKATIEPLADQLAAIKLKDRLTTLEETTSGTAGKLTQHSASLQTELTNVLTAVRQLSESCDRHNQQVLDQLTIVQKVQVQNRLFTFITWGLLAASLAVLLYFR